MVTITNPAMSQHPSKYWLIWRIIWEICLSTFNIIASWVDKHIEHLVLFMKQYTFAAKISMG